MTRWAARTDDNQAGTVAVLRQAGASVQTLHRVGGGCPDLLVGWRSHRCPHCGKDAGRFNYLYELKDGFKAPSRRQPSNKQREWHAAWRGQIDVVESYQQALAILGVE